MAKDLTVGGMATRSGVSVSALHFFERKGLIRSHRTAGNQRRYDREVLRRVALIQVAQESEVTLAEVGRALAALPDGWSMSRRDREGVLPRWAADLGRRIALRQRLCGSLRSRIGRACPSIDRCAIFNAQDRLASDGSGPHLIRHGPGAGGG